MSIFQFLRRRSTAPVARERLQILLAHERRGGSDSQLISDMKEDILRVIAKHMQIDRDKVQVKFERGGEVNTLEIDIELPQEAAERRAGLGGVAARA